MTTWSVVGFSLAELWAKAARIPAGAPGGECDFSREVIARLGSFLVLSHLFRRRLQTFDRPQLLPTERRHRRGVSATLLSTATTPPVRWPLRSGPADPPFDAVHGELR
ncbi:hypothetical protein [Arthrobacter bambusae]|uniref:hypothetical protein n=1 Tax=Arthrobacter bambusae TaxID=1338426 RepID=UPI00278922FC|nr:hypothetical protein [Arthrobacter bambusae]MDQ0029066.1 hypothetical protein [Arthrobacter bambusae]MDQ0098532.1 hypothetical protein [Arthrobacter bambusae]